MIKPGPKARHSGCSKREHTRHNPACRQDGPLGCDGESKKRDTRGAALIAFLLNSTKLKKAQLICMARGQGMRTLGGRHRAGSEGLLAGPDSCLSLGAGDAGVLIL